MPQKRGRSASPPGSKRRRAGVGILTTIPYINNDVLRKNLNLALSKADSRHDFDFNIAHNYLLTFTLNHLYGEAIAINDGNSYTDYTHDTDPFTKAINAHVHSYQVRGNFLIQDFDIVSQFKNGPVPKMNKKSIMGDVNGLDMRNKNIVTVSDNVSKDSLLNNLNSPPDSLNLTEMVTVSSIVDVGGRSVPDNWKDRFHEWWNECVDRGDNFTINLHDIGATFMHITLNVERIDLGNLTVRLTIEGYTIPVKFDLTQRGIGSCLMKETNGAYIFFSGKKIGNAFFEIFNRIFRDPALDIRSPRNLIDLLIPEFANIVSSTARIDLNTATQGTLNKFSVP